MKAWLVASLCFFLVAADNPGVQVSLTEDTLNTALFTFYAFYLTSAHFLVGDFNYTYKTDLGDVEIKLTNINITSISLDYTTSVLSLESPNILTYTIQDLEIDASAGYDIKIGLIPMSPGEAHVTATRNNATITIELSAVDGKPQVKFQNVVFTMGDVNVTTQLLKEFNELLNKELRDQAANLDKLLPSLAAKNEPKLNQLLSELNLVISCPVEPLAVDLGIVSGPSILGNQILVVGLNGTVLAGGFAVPAEPAVSVPVNSVLTEGLQVAVTDNVINSVLAPVWSTLNLTVSTLPASLGMSLTTDTLAMIIPQFRHMYGSNRTMMLNVYTDENSQIAYQTDGNFSVDAVMNVDFWVQTNASWVNALTLETSVSAEISADLTNNAVSCSLVSVSLDGVKQVKSSIGNVSINLMITLFNDLIGLVIDELNPLVTNYRPATSS